MVTASCDGPKEVRSSLAQDSAKCCAQLKVGTMSFMLGNQRQLDAMVSTLLPCMLLAIEIGRPEPC